MRKDSDRTRLHVTQAFIGHLEHHPDWPADPATQHRTRVDAAIALDTKPKLLRNALRTWHYPLLGSPTRRLEEAAADLIEQGKRRAAHQAARAQHKKEGTPNFITSRESPSGCQECGRDRHHHRELRDLTPRAHRFAPLLRPGARAEVHGDNLDTIRRRMRARRAERAAWFREHGHDPCAGCGVTSDRHPDEHTLYTGTGIPFGAPDEDFQRGPYEPPTDDQVLAYVVRERARRWSWLYPEDWVDEGWEDEMRHAADPYGDYDRYLD